MNHDSTEWELERLHLIAFWWILTNCQYFCRQPKVICSRSTNQERSFFFLLDHTSAKLLWHQNFGLGLGHGVCLGLGLSLEGSKNTSHHKDSYKFGFKIPIPARSSHMVSSWFQRPQRRNSHNDDATAYIYLLFVICYL